MKIIFGFALLLTITINAFADCGNQYSASIESLRKTEYDSTEGRVVFSQQHALDYMNEQSFRGGVKGDIIAWGMFLTNPAWMLPSLLVGQVARIPFAIKRGIHRRQLGKAVTLINEAKAGEGNLLSKVTERINGLMGKSFSTEEIAAIINKNDSNDLFCKDGKPMGLSDIMAIVADETVL